MEITPLRTDGSLSLPLPLYASVRIADALGRDGSRFFISAGLDERLVAELTRLSHDTSDTELQKHTGDRERFGEGAYAEWYAKERAPFALVERETGGLAALAWLGPKTMPSGLSSTENQQTLAYRCYSKFRGKGLMKDFVDFVITTYLAFVPNAVLWTEVSAENAASRALAEKLGFKTVQAKAKGEKKVIMIRA